MNDQQPNVLTRLQRIFVVHGRDEEVRRALVAFLKDLGKEPIVLTELPSGGRTVIEKFEHYAAGVDYAVVLLTPDDLGGLRSVRARTSSEPRILPFSGDFHRRQSSIGTACGRGSAIELEGPHPQMKHTTKCQPISCPPISFMPLRERGSPVSGWVATSQVAQPWSSRP
jgi:hypothetical protein